MVNKILNSILISSASLLTIIPNSAYALSGTEKLACSAVLCLSSGERPSECNPSLNHYFSIDHTSWADTVKDRNHFLNQCPWSAGLELMPNYVETEKQMKDLFSAIANGAGRCDAKYLNTYNVTKVPYIEHVWVGGDAETKAVTRYHIYVNSTKPNYCDIYENHEFTDFNVKYVGTPKEGGYWIDGQDYEAAQEKWQIEQNKKSIENKLRGRNYNSYRN